MVWKRVGYNKFVYVRRGKNKSSFLVINKVYIRLPKFLAGKRVILYVREVKDDEEDY